MQVPKEDIGSTEKQAVLNNFRMTMYVTDERSNEEMVQNCFMECRRNFKGTFVITVVTVSTGGLRIKGKSW